MNRRGFLVKSGKSLFFFWLGSNIFACNQKVKEKSNYYNDNKVMLKPYKPDGDKPIKKLVLTQAEWRKRLTEEEFYVLREEGTERPFSSSLNDEKKVGIYYCAGCYLDLFTSKMKYDSGSGWPSFYTTIPNRLEFKTDYKLLYPRKEYHCIRCGGHQGHVFKDGPPPTLERWCNNGVALKFNPEKI